MLCVSPGRKAKGGCPPAHSASSMANPFKRLSQESIPEIDLPKAFPPRSRPFYSADQTPSPGVGVCPSTADAGF